MAIDLNQAEEIAASQLPADVRVLSAKTDEFDVGWVFYYDGAKYLDDGNFGERFVGNAPLFVARRDGRCFFVSYHRPLVDSMAAYRACGNPNASEVAEVLVSDWSPGAIAVSAIKIIRQHA